MQAKTLYEKLFESHIVREDAASGGARRAQPAAQPAAQADRVSDGQIWRGVYCAVCRPDHINSRVGTRCRLQLPACAVRTPDIDYNATMCAPGHGRDGGRPDAPDPERLLL